MENASEALEAIVEATGCDLGEAREFCGRVQRICRVAPPYVSIATAAIKYDCLDENIQQIADYASRLSGRKDNVIAADSSSFTSSPSHEIVPSVYELDLTTEEIQPALGALLDVIAQQILGKLIAESIEGKVIGFTGNGPYLDGALESLARKLGATPDEADVDWDDLEWIVLGQEDFSREYLEQSVEVEGIEYLTQEEFLGRLFLGFSAFPEDFPESHNSQHSGIQFVRSLLLRKAETPDSENEVSHNLPGAEAVSTSYSQAPGIPDTGILTLPVVAKAPERAAAIPMSSDDSKNPEPASTLSASPSKRYVHPPASHSGFASGHGTSSSLRPHAPVPTGWNSLGQPPRSVPAPPIPSDFNWPDLNFDPSPTSSQHQAETESLRDESDLKKMGYSVAVGVSRKRRRHVLMSAVETLGIEKVARHVRWLIRFHRNSTTKQDAVDCWKEDYKWLQSRYGER